MDLFLYSTLYFTQKEGNPWMPWKLGDRILHLSQRPKQMLPTRRLGCFQQTMNGALFEDIFIASFMKWNEI